MPSRLFRQGWCVVSPAIDLGLIMQPNELLSSAVAQMGVFVYVILFAIVFAETGLVVAPFLPGDSLLFAAGALAGLNKLELIPLMVTLLVAAVLGDAVNYWIGRSLGRGILERSNGRLIKPEHVATTEVFFRKHGGKTIVLARFVPIVRTFAPFVAGMCHMPLARFWVFNISGAIAWVLLFTGAGYIFGNIPWIEENLAAGMIVIVFISVAPMFYEGWRRRRESKRTSASAEANGATPEPEPTEL
jgi:membrane-associated protein